ncbi:16786_t:CDS:2, partial [Dentiscutata erythropus]
MSFQERSISPTPSLEEVPWTPQSSASASASTNETSNEPNNETDNGADNKHFQTIDEVINLLKPFEEITRHFFGSKYPTINLIYPYVRMLKNKYAPVDEKGESVENWLTLIYGSSLESSDDNTSISSGDEDSIPSGGNRKQWQYAHRSIHSRGRGQGRKRRKRL